jgi:hypothetical protein
MIWHDNGDTTHRIPEPESSFNLCLWRLDDDKGFFYHFKRLFLGSLDVRSLGVSLGHTLIECDGRIHIHLGQNSKSGINLALERKAWRDRVIDSVRVLGGRHAIVPRTKCNINKVVSLSLRIPLQEHVHAGSLHQMPERSRERLDEGVENEQLPTERS